eukprot:scaffold44731_cov48-Attheya_sp.AAC.3
MAQRVLAIRGRLLSLTSNTASLSPWRVASTSVSQYSSGSATQNWQSRALSRPHSMSMSTEAKTTATATATATDSTATKTKTTTETQDDDECPEWQNPLHHNDPSMKKIMLSDFEPGETVESVPLPPIDDGSGKVLAAPHLHDIAVDITKLSMVEVMELVERIGDHFGIEDNDDDSMYAGGEGAGGAAAAEEPKEEKVIFDLKLQGFDAKSKIKVIKEVRAMTGLGLKEAKELVEGAPKTIKKDIKMDEAEALKAKLEAVGAQVEIA